VTVHQADGGKARTAVLSLVGFVCFVPMPMRVLVEKKKGLKRTKLFLRSRPIFCGCFIEALPVLDWITLKIHAEPDMNAHYDRKRRFHPRFKAPLKVKPFADEHMKWHAAVAR